MVPAAGAGLPTDRRENSQVVDDVLDLVCSVSAFFELPTLFWTRLEVRSNTSTGQSAGALGVTEIQEASPSSTKCTPMGRPVIPACSGAVRSLADGEGRFCCGSRMNGDVHVRF